MGWSAFQTPSLLYKTCRPWSLIATNSFVSLPSHFLFAQFFMLCTFALGNADNVTLYPAIPVEICSLSRLTTLAVPNNALKVLPEVGNFISFIMRPTMIRHPSYVTLFFSFNLQNIGGLVSLQILDLRCNDIQEIPVSLGQLSNLRVLDMRINDVHLVSFFIFFCLLSVLEMFSKLSVCARRCLDPSVDYYPCVSLTSAIIALPAYPRHWFNYPISQAWNWQQTDSRYFWHGVGEKRKYFNLFYFFRRLFLLGLQRWRHLRSCNCTGIILAVLLGTQ